MLRTIAETPPLDAAYADPPPAAKPTNAAGDEHSTSDPDRPADSSWAIARWQTRNVPVRLTSSTRRQSAAGRRCAGPPMSTPAAAITPSATRPQSAISSKSAVTSSSLLTSHVNASARPPIRSAAAATVAPSRSASSTRPPRRAISRAAARPMPEPAPVIRTVRSSTDRSCPLLEGAGRQAGHDALLGKENQQSHRHRDDHDGSVRAVVEDLVLALPKKHHRQRGRVLLRAGQERQREREVVPGQYERQDRHGDQRGCRDRHDNMTQRLHPRAAVHPRGFLQLPRQLLEQAGQQPR